MHACLVYFMDEALRQYLTTERKNMISHMMYYIELLVGLQIYEISLIAETMKIGGMSRNMIIEFMEGLANYIGINLKKRFIDKSNNNEKSVFFTFICFAKKEEFINYFDGWMILNKHRLKPPQRARNFDLREEILKKIAEIKQSETKNEEIVKKLSDVKLSSLFGQTKIDDSYINSKEVNSGIYQTTNTCNGVQDGEINSPSLFDYTKIDDSCANTGEVNDNKYQITSTYNEIQGEDHFFDSDTYFQKYDSDEDFFGN